MQSNDQLTPNPILGGSEHGENDRLVEVGVEVVGDLVAYKLNSISTLETMAGAVMVRLVVRNGQVEEVQEGLLEELAPDVIHAIHELIQFHL